jgi:hypothetical protein
MEAAVSGKLSRQGCRINSLVLMSVIWYIIEAVPKFYVPDSNLTVLMRKFDWSGNPYSRVS